MGLHDGHRQRTKEEFLAHGLAPFSELRTLELLLFYARPQGDVVPTAKALLSAFGSLEGVFAASQEELAKVPGVGLHTVVLLHLVAEVSKAYLTSSPFQAIDISDTHSLSALFAPCFRSINTERSALACFDDAHRLLGLHLLGEGNSSAVDIRLRQVVATALEGKTAVAVLAHNHPSGNLFPSQEDITTTRCIFQYLAGLDIYLADHVILGRDAMLSMRQSGFSWVFSN
jgi:DNA repair protein RadC